MSQPGAQAPTPRGAALAVALASLASVGCGDSSKDPTPIAETLVTGLTAAVEVAAQEPQPILCAALPARAKAAKPKDGEFDLGGATVAIEADTLKLASAAADTKTTTIAIVADAREPTPRTLETISGLSKQWDKLGVDLVVALGGMGQTKSELSRVLSPLVSKQRALVAMPGDRESVAELEAAIADLHGKGLPAFSTRDIRVIQTGAVTIGLLPGVGHVANLVAGGDGCLHRESDAAALVDRLRPTGNLKTEKLFWLSYAAPRWKTDSALSDLSHGIRAGETTQAGAIAKAGPLVVFHGQIEPTASAPQSGVLTDQATTGTSIAVGPIEDLPMRLGQPSTGAASVVVTIGTSDVRWQRHSHRPLAQ